MSKIFIKLFIFSLFLFQSISTIGKNVIGSDTVNSNLILAFSKVKPSAKEANTATMGLNYISNTNNFIIHFEVPSFVYRSNTSLADYCIIESGGKRIQLQNRVEIPANGTQQNIYSFIFIISKDSLSTIFSNKIKKIEFYFTPNKNIEDKLMASGNKLSEFDKHLIKLSKRSLKYKVSKPDNITYNDLMLWMNTL